MATGKRSTLVKSIRDNKLLTFLVVANIVAFTTWAWASNRWAIWPEEIYVHDCGTISSAATITVDGCDMATISGSTTVSTVNTCDSAATDFSFGMKGRRIILSCASGSSFSFGETGNLNFSGADNSFQCTSSNVDMSVEMQCRSDGEWYELNRSPHLGYNDSLQLIEMSERQLSVQLTDDIAYLEALGLGTPTGVQLRLGDTASRYSILSYLESEDGLTTYAGLNSTDLPLEGTGAVGTILDATTTPDFTVVNDLYVGSVKYGTTGNLDVSGNAQVDGTLDVDSAVVMDTTLNVLGNVDFDVDANVDGDITVDGEIKGSRVVLQFHDTTAAVSGYATFGDITTTAKLGFVMPHAGSVVGVSAVSQVTTHTSAGTIQWAVYKNGSTVFNCDRGLIATTDANPAICSATQARGIDVFAADDIITAYVEFNAFAGVVDNMLYIIEVVFDD